MGHPASNFLFSAILALLAALAAGGCSRGPDSEPAVTAPPASPPVAPAPPPAEPGRYYLADCDADTAACRRVLDCRDNAGDCHWRRVAFDAAACASQEDPAKCANFRARFGSVTLVADDYNLVSAPFTALAVDVELIADDLHAPWDLEFLPDGALLVTGRKGTVYLVDAAGKASVALELPVVTVGEAGLMGLAVDPDFATNRYVYLAYSHDLDNSDPAFTEPRDPTTRRLLNRISRWTLQDGRLQGEHILLDAIPGSILHTGLRLEFGPDGKLYASTGDAHVARRSQEPGFLGGKVLRLNTDGSVPADNPERGSYVYTRGHRNPQGLAWHPVTGDLYVSEHGPERYDEINRVAPGGNYGWGSFKCDDRMSRKEPLAAAEPPLLCFKYWNLSPSGMTFVDDPNSPWHGSLFVAGLRGKHLHRYTFDGDAVAVDEIFYVNDRAQYRGAAGQSNRSARLRDVKYRDGALYVIGDTNFLVKLTPRRG